MNTCEWDGSAGTDPKVMASLERDNLFSAVQKEPPSTEDAPSATLQASSTLLASLQQGPVLTADRCAAPPRRRDVDAQGIPQHRFESGGASFLLPNTEEQERVTAELRAQGARVPVRTIRDTAPTYSAVAIDENSDEVILQDNNLWSYRVFDRLSPTPKGNNDVSTAETDRARAITRHCSSTTASMSTLQSGDDLFGGIRCQSDKMVHFPREAHGDVNPTSILHTPHRVYNIAADEVKQEFFVTVDFQPEVVVYRKSAAGEERPLRVIEGEDTGLDGPHGIAVDEKDRLLFVNTWGPHSTFTTHASGRYFPPAIKVYALDSNGDAKPLRVITGDSTQLDWPAAMKYNPDNGDLYVANDIGASVLVFANAAKLEGNVAPARAIKGLRPASVIQRASRSTASIKRCGFRTWGTRPRPCIR